MRPGLKRFSVGCLIVILVPIGLFATHLGWIQYRLFRLRHADHALILTACREAIENRESYPNDKDKWGTLHEDDVLLLRPLPDKLPKVIRDLKPHDVIIRPDYAMLNLSIPFCRICLLGFHPGAKQFGTFQYIDGLWFWNGNDSTKKPEHGFVR
jgi:hypothetical protein